MRVALVTLGCKVNQYESRALEDALQGRGHRIVGVDESPDVAVVNSCTVTHRSDRDVRAAVRRARRCAPGARLVVCGCYAQVDPCALREMGVDLVVGTVNKRDLPALLEQGAEGVRLVDVESGGVLEAEPVSRFGERSRASLKVQDGCEAFCSYCIVPYARGPSRSLPAAEVAAGLARLREAGYAEVVLTGVHLGLWGRDLTPAQPFPALLDLAERSGVPRIRLSSLEPKELTPEVIGRMAGSRVLCPHLHVPLQSGSDPILAAMGRPYRAGEFRRTLRLVTEQMPDACLGLDVIAGFPGETDADFQATLALLRELPLGYLHVFPFSARRGTSAYGMEPKVDPGEVKRRAQELRALSKAKRLRFWASQVGRTAPAVVEGEDKAGGVRVRTRNYVPVRVMDDRDWNRSRELWVHIEAADERGTRGRLVPAPETT